MNAILELQRGPHIVSDVGAVYVVNQSVYTR